MDTPSPKLYFAIPVFNEAENLPRLFDALKELQTEFRSDFPVKIILINDGSKDNTGLIAQKLAEGLDFTLLTHERNLGPGCAFATAFKHLHHVISDDDWIVTMEGDNTSNHKLIRQMLTRTLEGYDVILASPYMYGGGISNTSGLRILLSYGANIFVKEILGLHGFFTVSSFFRIYKGSVLKNLYQSYGPGIIERKGFESMLEILMKMVFHGIAISEVPMLLDTSKRRGKSKMKLIKTILGYLALLRHRRSWENAIKLG